MKSSLLLFGLMAALVCASLFAGDTDTIKKDDYAKLIPTSVVHRAPLALVGAQSTSTAKTCTDCELPTVCFDLKREKATVRISEYEVTFDLAANGITVPTDLKEAEPLLNALASNARKYAHISEPSRADIIKAAKSLDPGTGFNDNLTRDIKADTPPTFTSTSYPPFNPGPYPVNSTTICHTA